MSRTWTEAQRALRAPLLLAFAVAVGGCGTMRPEAPTGVVAGPDPQAVAAFDAALAVLQAGDEAQAEAGLRALVDAWPDYAGPMVNLALLQLRRGEPEPAAMLLERAVTVCTHCAPAWNALGMAQRRLGQFTAAEQSYLRAIAAGDGYANAHFNLAVLYELYLQRPELALAEYGRYRAADAAGAGTEVDKWIADLERRTGAVERSARLEEAP